MIHKIDQKKCPRKSYLTQQILCLFKKVSNCPKSWIRFLIVLVFETNEGFLAIIILTNLPDVLQRSKTKKDLSLE